MKWGIVAMGYGLFLTLLAGGILVMAVVRFAPSDPSKWNVAVIDDAALTPGPCAQQIRVLPNGARAMCQIAGDPQIVLTKLAMIAEAWPRTLRLAGQVGDGQITWVSRSLIFGFPDYTTVQVSADTGGTRLKIFARQRFGRGDMGVNAARLRAWLAALDQPS